MYYVYLLQNTQDYRWYTGFTSDLKNRLSQHNLGKNFSTRFRGPFVLLYYEASLDKSDAQAREKYLKSGPGKKFLRNRLKRFFQLTGFGPTQGNL